MRDLLRGYATAALESAAKAGDARRVATDLAGFSRVLLASDPLRNALTDPAIPARARRGVVHDLLEGKAAPESQALVAWAALVEAAGGIPPRRAHVARARRADRRCGRGRTPPPRPARRAPRRPDRGARADPWLRRPVVPGGRPAGADRRHRGRIVSFCEDRRREPFLADRPRRPIGRRCADASGWSRTCCATRRSPRRHVSSPMC